MNPKLIRELDKTIKLLEDLLTSNIRVQDQLKQLDVSMRKLSAETARNTERALYVLKEINNERQKNNNRSTKKHNPK